MSKRILGVLMALLLVPSMLPIGALDAFAETEVGTGGATQPPASEQAKKQLKEETIVFDSRDITVDHGTVTAFNPQRFNELVAKEDVGVIRVKFNSALNIQDVYYNGDGKEPFIGKLVGKDIILELPESMEKTGPAAFKKCDIVEVKFNEGLEEISGSAFSENPKLKSVDFSANKKLKIIDNNAFNMSGIGGTVILPENLKTLGEHAFYGNKIEKVVFNNDIETIRHSAFQNNKIKDVDWGTFDKVKPTKTGLILGYKTIEDIEGVAIPSDLFAFNELESLTIPKNVRVIELGAFRSNKLQGKLVIPASVEYIGNYPFLVDDEHERKLEIEFAKNNEGKHNIKAIGYSGFKNLGIAGKFIIPESLEDIGDMAFSTNKITELDFNGVVPSVGVASFAANPLERIDRFNVKNNTRVDATFKEDNSYVFDETNSSRSFLKNVNFDYKNLDASLDNLANRTFASGLLKSLNFPSQITKFHIYDPEKRRKYLYGATEDFLWKLGQNPFQNNDGWYPEYGATKVALYRVDKDGNYVTDNAVDDSEATAHTFNPVFLEFKFVDEQGSSLPDGDYLDDSIVRGTWTRNTPSGEKNGDYFAPRYYNGEVSKWFEVAKLKLADRVTFKAPTVLGYDFVKVSTPDSGS